jgi:protein-S-isoprenylcysteine O-methyltransferase Ste14
METTSAPLPIPIHTMPQSQKDTFRAEPGSRSSAFAVAMTLLLLLALPPLVYYFWICLEYFGGRLVIPTLGLLRYFPRPTATSIRIAALWLLFQALLQIYAPGRRTEGRPLPDGSRLTYKMNGWASWWLTWIGLSAGVALGAIPPTLLADQFGPLLTTWNIFTFGFCLYLYGSARALGAASERITGNAILDFWLGNRRNPRIGNFDLKLFFEARPGLIGWAAIDLSLAAKQYQQLGRVTAPMVLVCFFQFWYVADYFRHEEAILTTWDIQHENFGFMLCWGDLVWVPFTYTIQAYYLLVHPVALPAWAIVAIVLLHFTGFAIFRGANNQKHRFRKDPSRPICGEPARFIPTAAGKPLLISGWWGRARHMNYFGDLLMGLAWCLTTGFSSALPYFYIVYFTILLVHRERRDNRMCAARYGPDWDSYCRTVPWRIVPGLY